MSWPKVFLVETFEKNGSPIIGDIRERIKGYEMLAFSFEYILNN